MFQCFYFDTSLQIIAKKLLNATRKESENKDDSATGGRAEKPT